MSKLPFDPNKLTHQGKLIYEAMVSKRKSQGAPFGGPYLALMNHPELCQKIEDLGYYLKFEGHLPRNIYQFVVLAVAKETGATFEWKDHINHAVAAGVPQNIIEQLKSTGINAVFPDPYDLAAEVLVAALVWKNIPEMTQAEAIKKYGLEGFLELVVLSGFYQMFSAINQGFNIS